MFPAANRSSALQAPAGSGFAEEVRRLESLSANGRKHLVKEFKVFKAETQGIYYHHKGKGLKVMGFAASPVGLDFREKLLIGPKRVRRGTPTEEEVSQNETSTDQSGDQDREHGPLSKKAMKSL